MSELDVQQKNKKKDLRNNIIVITLSVILVVMAVLFFMQRKDHSVIINELNAEKDSIKHELTEMVFSYDSLNTENDTINEQLLIAQTKVRDLLIEVEQTKKVSYNKISGYQKEVNSLMGVMRNFVVQIDSLNERNKILMAENLEVKEQYKEAEIKNEQLSKEKEKLQKNLQRAAMLEVRGLVAVAINSRSKATSLARKAQKIKIYFVLGSNITSKRGSKDIYARIMRPDQLLMSKSADNLFQFEDLKIQYSAMRNVNYEGNDLPVAIFWDNTNEADLMVGEYTVDLFTDGNNIGTTTLSIR